MFNHKPDEITDKGVPHIMKALLQMPTGSHTVLVYPNLKTIREIYTKYVSANLIDEGEMCVFLPFYETVDNVKKYVADHKANLNKSHETELSQSVMIQDCYDVLNGDFKSNGNSIADTKEVSKLAHFLNDAVLKAQKLGKKVLSIWIDTGAFYYNQRGFQSLIDYEQQIASAFKNMAIKQFCLYHQKDFESRLARSQGKQILDCHDRKLLLWD